jgi:peptide/nickel transport system substrate-binding protein
MKQKWRMSMIIAAIMMLVACGEELPDMSESAQTEGTEFEVDANEENTLMIGMTNAPDSFNPLDSPGVAGRWAQRFMYDSILDMPTETEFEPRLGSLETEDNQTFMITVMDDAYWSDGEPITAHDVAFTLNTIADPEVGSALAANVSMIEGTNSQGVREDEYDELSGIEVLDENRLEIRTKQPVDEAYISEFLGFHILIVPKHVFQDIPKNEIAMSEAATIPSVVSGPYEFVEYQEEDYLHLRANENYYLGTAQIEEIYLRVMSGTSLLTEFQAGNLHMAAGGGIGMVSHQDISLLEEIEGLSVEESPSMNIHYMLINTTDSRFEDPRVRQAFAYAINKESIVENLMDNRAEVIPALYTPTSPYKHETLDPYPYDPIKAQQLLEEAEFNFEEEITLVVPTGNVIREQAGDLIEQWLTEVGLTVSQQNYDFTTWLSMAREQEYDIGLMGSEMRVDPNIHNNIGSGGSNNNMGYENSEVDRLLQEGNARTSFEERYPIYEELQELFYEEMPLIPLYSDSQFSVKVDYLEGGMNDYWTGSLHDIHEWTLNP